MVIRMSTEIEIRTQINNSVEAIDKLLNNGFQDEGQSQQIDMMFDFPDGQLFKSGQKIRVRIENNTAVLTYKGMFRGDESASRRIELDIPLQLSSIKKTEDFLTSIGYPLLFQVKKDRRMLSRGGIKATFDEWPIIGSLLELEGEESEIKEVANSLFPENEFGNLRLKELFTKKCEDSGKTLTKLQEEYEVSTGFKLGNIAFLIG